VKDSVKLKKEDFLLLEYTSSSLKGKNIVDLPNYCKKFKTKGSTFTKQMNHTRLDLFFFKDKLRHNPRRNASWDNMFEQ
jgi:hypothetical protein